MSSGRIVLDGPFRVSTRCGTPDSDCIEIGAGWVKSTYSNSQGTCTEVRRPSARVVAVRDSTDPDGPQLAFGPGEWGKFMTRVKAVGQD